MSRRKRNKKRRRRQVKVPGPLHSALVEMQREFKKHRGEEPALGDLIEKAFEEDPVLEEVLKKQEKQESKSLWEDEEFMKL